MNDILWLTMRRMRLPLITILIIYFVSVFAMVLVPGTDRAGQVAHLSFLDAAYFVTIMATTIGFGEVPFDFNPAQRMLVITLILPNVIAWLYSIGAILGLFLDPEFRQLVRRGQFNRKVRWMGEKFFIVCGCGNTGSLIVRGLLRRGINAVVVEIDAPTIHRLELLEEFSQVPMLSADASIKENLVSAGLDHPKCLGVISVTHVDESNLTIAITCKLLRPELRVLARAEKQRTIDNLRSFGTDAVINPYAIFSERLYLALASPVIYLVQDWLISVERTRLRSRLDPPAGHWIVCGAGKFGEPLLQRLEKSAIPFTVVDVHPERLQGHQQVVLGRGTEADTLREAGVEQAVGIVAGTGDDIDNLSIIMTARELNNDLFVVARQERQDNDALFDAANADLVAKRSLIIARRVLAIVSTPLLQPFLQHLVMADDSFAQTVHRGLEAVLHDRAPTMWTINLDDELARGLDLAAAEGIDLRLRHIIQDTRVTERDPLPCLCLVLERGAQRIFLPGPEEGLKKGDRLLFSGRNIARREMLWGLTDENALVGAATGRHLPRGALWRWLWRRQQKRKALQSSQ